MGISWEKLGKNLELLVLVINELQINLGTSWEKLGNNLGKSIPKVNLFLKKSIFILSNQKTYLYLYQ
jgi:hypothetical protein